MNLALREERIERRSFLGYMIAAVGAFIGASLGTSTAIFGASPLLTERSGSQASLGPISTFQVGVPKAVEFSVPHKDGWVVENATKAVWVIRQGENDFTVLSGRCTHLGCAFNWSETNQEFLCPCHGGRFAADGQVLGGPPPRALDRLEARVQGGNLVVDYKEFRLGIPDVIEA